MKYLKKIMPILLIGLLMLPACDANNSNDQNAGLGTGDDTQDVEGLDLEEPTPGGEVMAEAEIPDTDVSAIETDDSEVTAANGVAMDQWLQQLNNGEIEQVNMGEDLNWGFGYFLYYGTLDSINSIGVDTIIYNALEVRRRLDTGEVTEDNLSQNEQNLLTVTEGLMYDSEQPLTDQVDQTTEIRESILEHAVVDQQNNSPEEALASNNFVGVFGPRAAVAIGGKYLVYTQESPNAEFEFLGVILAVDTSGQDRQEPYSFNDWENLTWLGDAAGPFWNDLPTGTSGEPENTGEARPGVLLVIQVDYENIETMSSE